MGDAESFTSIAGFYDDLMKGVPYAMWTGYYLLLLAKQDVHPKTVLDVCCGTGTMCERLTKEGLVMTGFDGSEKMIAVARRKAARKKLDIRYECMDARTFAFEDTFDAAFSFFDSLNYIATLEGFEQAVQRVAEHLPPGGSFIFDLNTAYAFEQSMFDQANLSAKSRVRYDWRGQWDPDTRLIRVEMDFWHGDTKHHETHVQRAHSDDEVRAVLESAGFESVEVFDSYGLERPKKTSDRVHYCAIRSG